MSLKKRLKIYYLVVGEGKTELIIFAYLTLNKFRELFKNSNIRFSTKVEIINKDGSDQIVSRGNMGGIGSKKDFQIKYKLIKQKYYDQKILFLLDKDLKDSVKIEKIIKNKGDVVQFMEYNSEYLLLKLAGKKPKKPESFKNLKDFRNYTKKEFKEQFKKEASQLNDFDLDFIFKKVSDKEIKKIFKEIFNTLSFKNNP